MLIGGDISHYNYPFEVGFGEFQIYKATEGKSFVDPKLGDYMKEIKNDDLIAFYHFARPDVKGNTPQLEAQNFVENVKKYIGKAVFVLDWEGKALKYSESYAMEWLREVHSLTGVKPMLYTSSSATKNFPRIAKAGYKLWVAHYNVQVPKVYNWSTWTMWQFTSKPFDVDLFNGTVEDWKDLCKVTLC